MNTPRESAEGERKRGEPGYVEVFAEDRKFTHRVTRPDRMTDQGFGILGEEEPLDESVERTQFVGTAKFHNTEYTPNVIGQQIGGTSLPSLVHYLRGKQKRTGVTDDKRYTYKFPEPTETGGHGITENGLSGRLTTRALTEAEIQQFESLLRGGDTVEAKLSLTKLALHDKMEQLLKLKPRVFGALRNVRDQVAGWFKKGKQ
ncbi:MAG: hypothetical protein ABIG34_04155 [Candidatus Peregrinibacteria bacterium]